MHDPYRTAYIYIQDIYAGILKETDTGYSFQYDKDYLSNPEASSASLTLPLQEKVFFSKTLFSFFDGLIPEGWLLDIVTHNWKININDRFGILLIACKDCTGNVSIREIKE